MSHSVRSRCRRLGRSARGVIAIVAIPAAALVSGTLSLPAQVPAPAASARPITLAGILELVERRSPKVIAARELARAADARVAGAARPPDPRLQLGFMNYSLPDIAPDASLGMVQLQVMQMIPTRGKLGAATRASRARAAAAAARAADVAWEARTAAAMAFWERVESERSVAIARETRRLLEDVAATATSMYRVGEGRQADVLRARVEIARMDEDIVRMETMRDIALARLAAATDTTPDAMAGSPIPATFPESLPSLDELTRLALASRPMLAAGDADVRAAEADASLARRELWPDLEVGVQYGQRRMDMGVDRMGSLMIGASLPVFARSRQLRMRDETDAMRRMAEAELTAMRADTRARIAELLATLGSTRRLATLYRTTVLPQAEAATTSSLASYRTGAADFMTALDDRMGVNRYRRELLALVAAEGRAWAELEMLVGRPLLSTVTPLPGSRELLP